ncbi:MAG: helix-turn-helix transcriptional regulator [Desulfocapsaceae bacterium]|nr:helix-turn-helix transcriptional regulator [Desulfocapsaceae bacterium]
MKRLNIENIKNQLDKLGLSQSSLTTALGVSKQSVSNWLSHTKYPRPATLLKLAQTLKLTYNEIVIKEIDTIEPVIAFRKKGNHKISDDYIEDARDKGYLLEHLVPYLPYDNFSQPPVLKEPILDYDYIHQVADTVRKDIGKSKEEEIKISDLITFFNTNHAVLIPVFWGNKRNHENALHVFLPSSMTTWIYINLDSKIHDFKFWLAHELGHVKAPSLRENEAEDFADKFAGSLLISRELAKREYLDIKKLQSSSAQVSRIIDIAKELIVSPLTVYFEINRYAEHANKPIINLETDSIIYRANTAFCSKYYNVAETLFEELPPSPHKYINISKDYFKTPFFDALEPFLKEKQKSPSFLQSILSISPPDAHALYEEMC